MSQRDDDLELLHTILASDKVRDEDREAFVGMQERLAETYPTLTEKQRSYAKGVAARLEIVVEYANLASSGAIPPPKKPREPGYVALMVGALPKRPPPMPKEPERPQRVTAEHRPFKVVGLDEKDDE